MSDIPAVGTVVYKIDEYAAPTTALKKGVVVAGSIATEIFVAWLAKAGEEPYIERESGLDIYEKAEDAITAYLRREEAKFRRQLRDLKN